MPRHARRADPHRVPHRAGGAGRSQERRDLAVGHDAPGRHAAHQRVNALLESTRHARAAASAARALPEAVRIRTGAPRASGRGRPAGAARRAGPRRPRWPCWSTTTRSARWMVDRRCAITMLVRPADELVDGVLEQVLGLRVDARRGFVEHQDGGIIQERPGHRKELALSVREVRAALEQRRVVSSGERADERVGVRRGAPRPPPSRAAGRARARDSPRRCPRRAPRPGGRARRAAGERSGPTPGRRCLRPAPRRAGRRRSA